MRKEHRDRWSWVIAFSCCWINIFIFGVFRSFGVLYLAVMSTFRCSQELASWPFTLASGVASLSALPSAFLTHYYSIRSISFFGVFICSFAISICFFASDVYFIIVFLGIIQGIGIGFSVLLLPVIISEYFDKERAMACGISYSGAAIGSFIFPLLTEWLLEQFGLQGTLLLLGGITCHAFIGVLLLRPIRHTVNKANDETLASNVVREEICSMIDENECSDCKRTQMVALHCDQADRTNGVPSENIFMQQQFNASTVEVATHISINNSIANCGDILFDKQKSYSRNVNNKSFLRTIRTHITNDCVIVKNPYFSFVTVTYIAYCFVYIIYLIILPAFAIERSLTLHEGTLLASLFSFTDLLGRLLPGWLSYKRILTNKSQFVLSMFIMSIAFALTPFVAKSFTSFSVITLVVGFCIGCQMVLPAVVMSEFLGVENTAVAFGFANFISGCFSPIRAILIGNYLH
ncbi:monocarboxylate transporter 12-like protein [Leptotrombidium deliense]|uniref:Monocarboxylate transporter 12-like protein n=1 Tax=Leptotrombidium deliense TaxID=299467 RepID=A0A443SDR9_9ACAR|nr:monocarboxylate transporter 12-like protein [Leptotrombidium deliense]